MSRLYRNAVKNHRFWYGQQFIMQKQYTNLYQLGASYPLTSDTKPSDECGMQER